ncbi:hypothetical protein [Psychromicrobium sp. YIM B11713]|uniref:hypothetical protein n=1 Tax=Psychromicrobium sp. YIM B11713 TaxID=3145233 RepID=UPI00374F7707
MEKTEPEKLGQIWVSRVSGIVFTGLFVCVLCWLVPYSLQIYTAGLRRSLGGHELFPDVVLVISLILLTVLCRVRGRQDTLLPLWSIWLNLIILALLTLAPVLWTLLTMFSVPLFTFSVSVPDFWNLLWIFRYLIPLGTVALALLLALNLRINSFQRPRLFGVLMYLAPALTFLLWTGLWLLPISVQ